MADVKNFYLNKIMAKHEYYNISINLIPQEIVDKYNLMDKQINGFLCVKVDKRMYELVKAGIIEHTVLKEHIRPLVYDPASITPGFWCHNKNGKIFTLVVNDFGIELKIK